jgi:hypothetical protein
VTEHGSPAAIMARLSEIEADFAGRMNDLEQAADDRARLLRDWEYRLALYQKKATGSSAEMRKAHALVAAIEQDDLHERLSDAEARYDALRSVVKVLEARSVIGMSLLRSHSRA